jgi:hypothetical protein
LSFRPYGLPVLAGASSIVASADSAASGGVVAIVALGIGTLVAVLAWPSISGSVKPVIAQPAAIAALAIGPARRRFLRLGLGSQIGHPHH